LSRCNWQSSNRLASLEALVGLTRLVVLNASRNAVSTTDFALRSASAGTLSALVLAGNGLRELAGLSRLQQLNTLVLSHNEFEVRLACACVRVLRRLCRAGRVWCTGGEGLSALLASPP